MASTPLIPVILVEAPAHGSAHLGQLPQAVLAERRRRGHVAAADPAAASGPDALAAPLLICNEDHRFIVAEQMRDRRGPTRYCWNRWAVTPPRR